MLPLAALQANYTIPGIAGRGAMSWLAVTTRLHALRVKGSPNA